MRNNTDPEPSDAKRFRVELFIVHPTITPAEISIALRMTPEISHGVGEPRTTPKGTPLPGLYRDTRWRYSVEYSTSEQWFRDEVEALVTRLEPHREFLSHLSATGSRSQIIIQFLDGAYFGDSLPAAMLARMAALGLSLGIEVYTAL